MRRFPVGLTVAAVIAFSILIGLGLWQLDRLKQTNANRSAIAALAQAPARALEAVLAEPASADHARVEASCLRSQTTPPTAYRYSLRDGVVGWRLLTMCRTGGPTFDGLLLDRGFVTALGGQMTPSPMNFAPPLHFVGVLRKLGRKPLFGDDMSSGGAAAPMVRVVDAVAVRRIAARAGSRAPAPFYAVVERETPAAPGVTPSPVTEDTPRDNFGYALTWFGLALALAGVWGAFVLRWIRQR